MSCLNLALFIALPAKIQQFKVYTHLQTFTTSKFNTFITVPQISAHFVLKLSTFFDIFLTKVQQFKNSSHFLQKFSTSKKENRTLSVYFIQMRQRSCKKSAEKFKSIKKTVEFA